MAGDYTVTQGDHVPGIAKNYGFSDYNTIWNHPKNSELKKKRQNPNVLYPGDSVYIPDREEGEYDRPTDKKHQWVLKQTILKLRLKLLDLYERPIANAACILTVDSDSHRLTTGGDGKIELEIPPTASKCTLVIEETEETPYQSFTIDVKIGHLDPVDEVSGQKGRLSNLGYFRGDMDGNTGPDFESAVQEFQCEHGLKVDGVCGPATQAKLKQFHGS
jgi:hypothetical protein